MRDIGILEAAVARTRATVYGEDAYPDLDAKAAALLHSIVTATPSSTATSDSAGSPFGCSAG